MNKKYFLWGGALLIVVVAIILLIKKTISKFQAIKLYNGDNWANYRLGDVFFLDKNHRMYNPDFHENILYHKNQYIGTIANEYINQNKMQGKNEKLLRKLIEKRIKDKNPYPETLFLHIRVGDVLCTKDNDWINQVNGPLYYSKVGDTNWWKNVLDYINTNNINEVVILSGSHMNKCLSESASYIEDRKQFLEKSIPDLKVTFRLGQSPDEDLTMCYYVKHFISTGGGYGKMIKEIKMKNNE